MQGLTFDVMVDDPVAVQILEGLENLPRDPDDLRFSHRPTAVQLLQDRAPLSSLHEHVQGALSQDSPKQFGHILVAKAGLDLNVRTPEVLQWDLEGEIEGEWRGRREKDVNR